MSNPNVNEARRQLVSALGESSKSYFAHLKSWFCMKMTKEDFDRQARLLLPLNRIHLHNEFLLAVLTKCQSLCQPTDLTHRPRVHELPVMREENVPLAVKEEKRARLDSGPVCIASEEDPAKPSVKIRLVSSRRRSGRINHETRFQPVEPIEMLPSSPHFDTEKPRAGYCARDSSLPDVALIHGRILLASWESGLDQGCDNDSVELLLAATRLFLKRLLTAVVTTRKGFKLRERKFVHSAGQPTVNPWIHNSWNIHDRTSDSYATEVTTFTTEVDYIPALRLPFRKTEREAAYKVACTEEPVRLGSLSTKDLFLTLQVQKNIIPCHTVYAVNMERISSRLYHPDD